MEDSHMIDAYMELRDDENGITIVVNAHAHWHGVNLTAQATMPVKGTLISECVPDVWGVAIEALNRWQMGLNPEPPENGILLSGEGTMEWDYSPNGKTEMIVKDGKIQPKEGT
jgi:hypothetical protein